MPEITPHPLTDLALPSSVAGQFLLAQGPNGIPTASDTVTRAKSWSISDNSTGIAITKEAGSNSIACLDLYNRTAYVDHMLRIHIDGAAVGLPAGSMFPRFYINGGGHLYNQGAITASGTFTGSGDNTVIQSPSLAPTAFSGWADVFGPVYQARVPMGIPTGHHWDCIDNAGLYRMGIQSDGSLWWGNVAQDNVDAYYWPAFDANLYRVGVAGLGTDGDFYLGQASGSPRDNRLVLRAAAGSTSHLEMWSNGAASLQLFSTSANEGHLQVGSTTVLRYFNNPIGVAGASVAIGGVDDATAALIVDNGQNSAGVKGFVVRRKATQSANVFELQDNLGNAEMYADLNGIVRIIGLENAQNGLLTLQCKGTSGNDDAALVLRTPASPNTPAARSHMLVNNFNASGWFEILRSTTSTGNPSAAILAFDTSDNAILAGALKLPAIAEALIPNGGIAWSSDNPGTLKARTPAGTLKTVTLT